MEIEVQTAAEFTGSQIGSRDEGKVNVRKLKVAQIAAVRFGLVTLSASGGEGRGEVVVLSPQ